MALLQNIFSANDFRNTHPCTTVRCLFKVIQVFHRNLIIQSLRICCDVACNPLIYAVLIGPQKPVLNTRNKLINVKAGNKSRIQICKLIFFTIVYRRNDAASCRKRATSKLTVQSKVHNCLQNFRTGTVQFIKKEDNRGIVCRKPVWRHKLCVPSLFIFMRNTNQISRVTHLA